MSKAASFFACFLFVFCFSLTASAAAYTVTKTADTSDGVCDADCSLREAIFTANATPDNDTIEFSALFSSIQTITLASGELVVGNNGSLTINGPGPELLTISGNNASRILSSGANVVVNINNLRFTAGNGVGAVNTGRGGAVYNVGGTMVITNSVFTGNTAANGGALNNAASASPSVGANLTIIGCSFTGNSSTSSGAAMQNFSTSTLHLRNTTISGNTSSGTGIAGAFQANGTVTITNSTISGNSAPSGTGGGVYYNGSSLIMTNTTIVNNSSSVGGGGLHRTGTNPTANVRNSIIANNNGAASTPDAFGAITSQGNNIVGNVGTSTGWVMSDLQNVNPQLGGLAANGGLGQTHLPLTESPALDAGQNCVVDSSCSAANPPVNVTTDQRGITRPQNAIVDIGAVEVAAASAVTVTGNVYDSSGYPVKGATVSLTDSSNVTRYTKTNTFGAYSFSNVPFGANYTLNASSKGLTFNGIVFNTDASPTDIDLFALNSNLTEFDK